MKVNNSSGFTRPTLVIGLLTLVFVVASVVGITMDSSVRKSTPKITTAQTKSLSSSSSSSGTSNSSSTKLKVEVEVPLSSIQSMLEAYFATNNYYPGNLSPAPIISQSGVQATNSNGNPTGNNQSLASEFTPPTGVKYVYTPTPSGCTTASKSCQHYTLSAIQTSNGAILESKTSLN